MWAIIAGTGLEKMPGFQVMDEELDRNTPFGLCSSGFKRASIEGQSVLFLPRHGQHHESLPSEVNFRANIYQLKKMGAKKILAISAVGSLREELKAGDMVVPTQYIDQTRGVRKRSFSGDGFASHVSLADPTSSVLIQELKKIVSQLNFPVHFNRTYVTIEGPQFSTRAESRCYRQMGADIVGMTHFPEYALAREAGLHYVPCCFVTDFDSWDDVRPHASQDEISAVMRENMKHAFQLIQQFLPTTKDIANDGCSDLGLKLGLLTPWENIPMHYHAWLSILIDKK